MSVTRAKSEHTENGCFVPERRIYVYIFIRARGYRSNLDSSEFKGCNSNVRGRVHLQAARRLFKVSSEMVETQCVSCPCCAFRNKFCALCTRIWNPRLTATLVPQIEGKKGGGMKFLERLFTIHGRHNRRLFNSNELFFQPRDYHGHA